MNKIGSNFKLKRKRLGLTQSAFSKMLGIAQGYLSDIENGLKTPSDHLLILLNHINRDKEEESYKKKFMALAEEHISLLKEVVSLKEQAISSNKISNFSPKIRKKS